MLDENCFLKPIQRLYTTYHLWDKWMVDVDSDGMKVLVVDELSQILFYSPVKKVYRNKAIVSILLKQDDVTERIILLDPQLELSKVTE